MNDEHDPLRDLLRAARPSGQDDADADMRAAREATAADAELQAALAGERQADAAIARALRSVAPPADLEARLLTAVRAARAQVEPPPGLEGQLIEAVRTTRTAEAQSQWSRRQWLGLAASVVACAAGALWWQRRSRLTVAGLTARLTTIAREGVTLSLMSMDKSAVAAWLRTAQAPRAATLPPKLDALPRKGCHLYDIDGHPVSLECFVLPSMAIMHLFTTPSADLRDAPPPSRAADVGTREGFTVATWSSDTHTMLLVSEQAPETVQALLG